MAKYTVALKTMTQWVGTDQTHENWLEQEFDSEEAAQEAIDGLSANDLEEAHSAALDDHGVEYNFEIVEEQGDS